MVSHRPPASSDHVRLRFAAQKREGTQPERTLRSTLHSQGLRYRVGFPIPGMPRRSIDIAFTKARVAVFVDGCFWHGCPAHGVRPKTNSDWWEAKLLANRTRDAATDEHLASEGWVVVRIWEHDLRGASSEAIGSLVGELAHLVDERRKAAGRGPDNEDR